MAAYVVAAALALIVAAFEQASQFGLRRLPLSRPAWKWWSLRIGFEMLSASIVVALAQAAGVDGANRWTTGLVAVLVSTLGLRSSFLDLPEETYGARNLFDRGREYVTTRLRNTEALAVTQHLVDEVLPVVGASTLTPADIAGRVTTFVKFTSNLTAAQRADELAWITDTVNDDATDPQERNAALIEKALEVGGDELVDQILDDARRHPPE
jgi:hypothetical protein